MPVTTVYRNEELNGCQVLAKCKAHPVSANENDGECIYCVLAEETITMLNTIHLSVT